MRPIANARYQAVFHRIVMNVIHMPDKIVVVTDGVFPVTSLPKRKFAIRVTPDSDAGSEQLGAEVSFDAPPSPSEIRVAVR
jgi:hypothetical protein